LVPRPYRTAVESVVDGYGIEEARRAPAVREGQ